MRSFGAEESGELTELWRRLELLKSGIGGWVVTAASMPPFSAAAIDADDKIREATEVALRVKAQIAELTPARRTPAPPPPRGGVRVTVVPAGPPPLSPVTGIPVVQLPDTPTEPGSGGRLPRREPGRLVDPRHARPAD